MPQDKKIVQVAGGIYHTLALDSEGVIYAWGYNTNGRLGNNSKNNSLSPVVVDASGVLNGKKVAAISAGSYSSFALDSEGRAYAWGKNSYSALGNASYITYSQVPIAVNDTGELNEKALTRLSSGNYSSAVLDADGYVYTWGLNTDGQLGNGNTDNSSDAVKVSFGEKLDRSIVSITFGSAEAIGFEVISDDEINIVVPPHAAGLVDVVVTDNKGNTWTILNGYEYLEGIIEPPVVVPPTPDAPDADIQAPNTGVRI